MARRDRTGRDRLGYRTRSTPGIGASGNATEKLAKARPRRTSQWRSKNVPNVIVLTPDDIARGIARNDPAFDLRRGEVLRSGLAREDGTPLAGRASETRLLRAAGYRDLAFGRLYEGHVNALQLIARCGTNEQRHAAERDVTHGRLFGVWNTQAQDGVRVAQADASGVRLVGRKTFCSGAGRVGGGLITARTNAGDLQMVVVDMERERPPIDRAFWKPLGMEASDSYAVDFTGVLVRPSEVLGAANDYERAPWFGAGAARFVAVQTGGVERLAREYAAWVRGGERANDPLAIARLGECSVAARTCHAWTQECASAWAAYDGGTLDAEELATTVDAARVAVERAALDVAEAVERGVGARGLLEPAPFSRLVRDLRMYLRQPAPDQALMRVGRAALEENMER